jgi:hypothetical protein
MWWGEDGVFIEEKELRQKRLSTGGREERKKERVGVYYDIICVGSSVPG